MAVAVTRNDGRFEGLSADCQRVKGRELAGVTGSSYRFKSNVELFCHVSHLRPILRLELPHDVADMHLHGALLHLQLVGDDLVWLALAQFLNHLGLPRSEDFGDARPERL